MLILRVFMTLSSVALALSFAEAMRVNKPLWPHALKLILCAGLIGASVALHNTSL